MLSGIDWPALPSTTAGTTAKDAPPVAWAPLPGPQTQALESGADVLGFGGAGGGGKTDLALGLAGLQHTRSVIFRREFPQLSDVIERSREIFARGIDSHARDSFNEQQHRWRLADGKIIELAACQYEKDKEKQRGRPRDLHVFDEATQFSESQFRFITGWNRTAKAGQRCRIVLCFNPPTDEAGRWVIRYFLPWMAYLYPTLKECRAYQGTPAAPGELRYFAMVDGVETEVPASTPKAKSRTFIPARVEDNPYMMAQGYDATLEAMPEPLRSQMRYGDFTAGASQANPWQIIPDEHIAAALARWQPRTPTTRPTGVGEDVSRGGRDATVVARLYGAWLAPLQVVSGRDTDTGPKAAALVLSDALDGAPVGVDIIGIGASAYDSAIGAGAPVLGVNFAAAARDHFGEPFTDRTGKLSFVNLRAYGYWRLRELLDPLAADGDPLALPPDPDLAAELALPLWSLTPRGVQVESKEDIIARLGRSPDRADALVIAILAPLLLPPPPMPVPAVAPVANRWRVPQ